MGLDRIWNLDLDLDLLRFHLLLLRTVPFTFRLVLSWLHACPCPCPCPPTFWAFPTPSHPIPQAFHQSWHHIHISTAAATTTRSTTYPYPYPSCVPSFRDTHQHLPIQCQKIALEPLSHILHSHSRSFVLYL